MSRDSRPEAAPELRPDPGPVAAEDRPGQPEAPARPRRPGRPGAAPADPDPPDADIAPVDRQSDPAHWLPGRAVLVAAIASAVLLVITVAVCLLLWFTPGMEPLQIPEVEKA
jgi:hypothetical protein